MSTSKKWSLGDTLSSLFSHLKNIAQAFSKIISKKSTDSKTSSKSTQDKQTQGSGDCLYKGGNEEISSRIPPNSPNFISFYCGNRWKDEEIIHPRFTIWIPEKLLKEPRSSFKEGKVINIKTRTSNITDTSEKVDFYNTIFECDSFSNTPIKGKWGGTVILGDDWTPADLDYQIYAIKIIEPQVEDNLIYLRMEDF